MIPKRLAVMSSTLALLVAAPLNLSRAGETTGVDIASADLNGDNVVNAADRDILFADWGSTDSINDIFLGSPANGPTSNGVVDVDDLNIIQQFFGQTVTVGQTDFSILGADFGDTVIAPGLIKGSPVVTDAANGFYVDPLASVFGSGFYAPLNSAIQTFASIEFTSYLNFDTGPSTAAFTANGPDFSTPGFGVNDGHFETFAVASGAWYTDTPESSSNVAGVGEAVHVARMSIDRGANLNTQNAQLRVLVDLGGVNIQTVLMPLNGGPAFFDEFGSNLPLPIEAVSFLTAQPDNVNGIDLDVYDIYVRVGQFTLVDAGGGGDFNDIQPAIMAASPGDTIVVNPGSYSPIDFLGKPITVRSSDPFDPFVVENTIIDAFGKQSVVEFQSGEGNDAVLDGFTITGGDSTNGGGIFVDGAGPSIRNCVIEMNQASGGGGGIYLSDAFLTTIEHCTFDTNTSSAGGAIMVTNFSDDVLIFECDFINNSVVGGPEAGGAIFIESGQATIIDGCSFTLNSAPLGGAIHVNNGPATALALVENCVFSLNSAGSGGAIWSSGTDFDCVSSSFISNTATDIGGGVALQNSSRAINCIFDDNSATNQGGGAYLFSDFSEVTNCTIVNNSASDGGGVFHADADAIISNSIIVGNTPDQIDQATISINVNFNIVEGGFSGVGNIDADPLFVDESNGNFRLMSGSPAIDAASNNLFPAGLTMDFDGQPRFVDDPNVADTGQGTPPIIDMGAFESQGAMFFTVDDDGPADFSSIQDAIDAAMSGAVIQVNDGTYTEVINFDGKDVAVESVNGAGVTIIDGNMMGSVVVFDSGELDASLDGFTITNGSSSSGGGVFISGSSPAIRNCNITMNTAGLRGAGVYIEAGADVLIANSSISANDAGPTGQSGGIHVEGGSTLTLNDSTIIGNNAERGGGLQCVGAGSVVDATACVFRDNTCDNLGAATNHGNSTGNYTQCIFENNTATNGGGAFNYFVSDGLIVNCLAFDNSGGAGGAIRVIDASNVTIVNSTFTENSGTSGGGLHLDVDADAVVSNCIFWNNGTEIVVNDVDSTAAVTFSNVQGGFAGAGNIDTDPIFADASADDFTIAPFSPAIDAGDNTSVPGGITTDLGGSPRFFDDTGTPDTGAGTAPIIDMGAYEFQGMSFVDCDGDGVDDNVDLSMPNVQNGAFPLELIENTTGEADSTFIGAPDDAFFGLGNAQLTYVLNGFRLEDGPGPDLNVYERDNVIQEFNLVAVQVSLDGMNFVDITSSMGPAVTIPGDGAHGDPMSRMSYDLAGSGLAEARFLRFVGTSSEPPALTAGFEIDAIGLINTRALDANTNGVIDDCEISTLFVDANADGGGDGLSWENAYTSLSDALSFIADQQVPCIDVFVAQGSYVPPSVDVEQGDFATNAATFSIPDGANLIGGFSGDGTETDPSQADPETNLTILSGDANGDDGPNFTNRGDNSFHVVTVEPGATVTIQGFIIRGGNAAGAGFDDNGGGLFMQNGLLTVLECVFEDNQASGDGGAVALGQVDMLLGDRGVSQLFENCTFDSNLATNSGGAICADGVDVVLDTCLFGTNSSVSGSGGAVSFMNGTLFVDDSTFDTNSAGIFGGGIHTFNASVNVFNSDFLLNNADLGGAIFSERSDLTVDLAEFTNNNASSVGGGICFLPQDEILDLRNSSLIGNASDGDGGAIYYEDSDGEVIAEAGGDRGSAMLTVSQCVFAGNNVTGEGDGAAIYSDNVTGDASIQLSSFADNSGSSNTVYTDGDLFITNSILYDNNTTQDITTFGSVSDFNYSIIEAFLTSGDFRGTFENVFSVDPLFVDVQDGNLQLRPGSPAIDAGNTQAGDIPGSDLFGNPRTVDDAGTPDTGIPDDGESGPVIDMGAFEFQGTTMQPDFFPFGEPSTFSSPESVLDLDLDDLDGDGDLDVIVSMIGKSDVLVWYEATRGDFNGSTQRTIDFLTHSPIAQDVGDINNDGDLDVVLLTDQDLIVFNSNGAATPTFSDFSIFPSLLNGRSLDTGDIDMDGDLDVLVGLNSANAMRWYENTAGNGTSEFADRSVLSSTHDFQSVALADIDRDGDLDAVGADNGGVITLARNETNGSSFVGFNISAGFAEIVGLAIADVNGDGAPDVIFGAAEIVTGLNGANIDTVQVAINNGIGTSFSTMTATDNIGGVKGLDVADVDHDGDIDVLVATGSGSVEWLENDGNAGFTRRMAFDDEDDRAVRHIVTGDTTLTGRASLILASDGEFSGIDLRHIRNQLIRSDSEYPSGRVIEREGNGITTIASADLDGDGDLDLVTGSFFEDEIIWYQNPGDTTFPWPFHVLTDFNGNTTTPGPTRVHTADVDGDGDPDIVATSILDSSVVVWFNEIGENLGNPLAFDAAVVTTNLAGAYDVDTGDFDGNGTTDFVYAGATANRIDLALNNGFGPVTGGSLIGVTVSSVATGVRSAVPSDIDRDGDLDIFAALTGAGRVVWYENTTGDGLSWDENLISDFSAAPTDIAAVDFDNDGDMDIAVVDATEDALFVYENAAGGTSWPRTTVATDLNGATAVSTGDYNRDGFPDIAVASRFENSVRYFLSDAGANRGIATSFVEADDSPISTNAMSVQSLGSADIDGDGRTDIFAGTFAGDEAVLYRNLGGQYTSTISTDLDGPVFEGDNVQALDINVTNLAPFGDPSVAFSELRVQLLTGLGAPMDASMAASNFDRITITTLDIDIRGIPVLVGEITDFGGISNGLISLPLDGSSATFVDTNETQTFTVTLEIDINAAATVPNGFEIVISPSTGVIGAHAPAPANLLTQQNAPSFSTGAISIQQESVDPCLADCNNSGVVDFNDMICILFLFGNDDGVGDLDGSGVVDFNDLILVLFSFGPCQN